MKDKLQLAFWMLLCIIGFCIASRRVLVLHSDLRECYQVHLGSRVAVGYDTMTITGYSTIMSTFTLNDSVKVDYYQAITNLVNQ